ncbi:hypothetical protein LX32DRAFT_182311 [Colletotrichum zoysiae]|uniref:Uncharacterized protein n=1 Tax=Colletotrichum zoysiae TaxID=1216348 RepID=A0AAD9HPG5_9PEZI|nr:hypothetical protein LX32DRAFT_182311 [Colletotrichum zoysiae]
MHILPILVVFIRTGPEDPAQLSVREVCVRSERSRRVDGLWPSVGVSSGTMPPYLHAHASDIWKGKGSDCFRNKCHKWQVARAPEARAMGEGQEGCLVIPGRHGALSWEWVGVEAGGSERFRSICGPSPGRLQPSTGKPGSVTEARQQEPNPLPLLYPEPNEEESLSLA